MKVSMVMNAIPRFTPEQWLDDLRSLAELNCQALSLPFINNQPMPQDINIVRNCPGGAINAQKLELKAAYLGLDRLTWLFGADAEFIGLELKDAEKPIQPDEYTSHGRFDPDPVLLLAMIRERKSSPLDAQNAYFIDQFTEQSLNRCCALVNQEYRGTPSPDDAGYIPARRGLMVKNILFSLQNYDTGHADTNIHLAKRNAIKDNSRSGSAGFIPARNAYQSYTKNYGNSEKLLFNVIRAYTEIQETATPEQAAHTTETRATVHLACQSLLGNIRRFSKVWLESRMFTRRLASQGFTRELSAPLNSWSPKQEDRRS